MQDRIWGGGYCRLYAVARFTICIEEEAMSVVGTTAEGLITHIAGPPQRPLRVWLHAALHAELVREPLRKQKLLDLPVGERVREVADEPNGELDRRLRPLGVRQTLLNELEDGLNVRQDDLDLGRVLEPGDDTGVRLEDTLAQRTDVFDEVDVKLEQGLNQLRALLALRT